MGTHVLRNRLRRFARGLGWMSVVLATPLAVALTPSAARALPSLAGGDTDELAVTVHGQQETFTVIADSDNADKDKHGQPKLFYYVPDKPRLYERDFNGRLEPEFSLFRYSEEDPNKPGTFIDGGLLQFSASLAIPSDALDGLKSQIAQKYAGGDPNKVQLSALPIKAATCTIYVPASGNLVSSAPHVPPIAPIFATQKMAFMVETTRVGTDLYNAISTSNTGVAVLVMFDFEGLGPTVGYKVHLDWNQTYQFLSRDEKFRLKLAWLPNLPSTEVQGEWKKVRETLEQNQCLEIEAIAGAPGSDAPFDPEKYLLPIITRINQEMLEDFKFPQNLKDAEAAAPNAEPKNKDWIDKIKDAFEGTSLGYSINMKDISQVKKGQEWFSLNQRYIVSRKTLASGYIGIGQYPKEIQDKLIIDVPPGCWPKSYFGLPPIEDKNGVGITQVTLTMNLAPFNIPKVASWQPGKGWTDILGQPITYLAFDLFGRVPCPMTSPPSGLVYESTWQVISQPGLLSDDWTYKTSQPVFDGQSAIVAATTALGVATIDTSGLTWRQMDKSSKLINVQVRLDSGGRTCSATIMPRYTSGSYELPPPLMWLVDRNPDVPVHATIVYFLSDGTRVKSQFVKPDDNLRDKDKFPGLTISLVDADWQR